MTVTRFEVRDTLGAVLWERRSESLARKCAKAEARCRAAESITVIRVEQEGPRVRERRVAVY